MTMTRFTLEDVGGALSWASLLDFLAYVPASSATWAATHEGRREESEWQRTGRVQMLLAQAVDDLNWLVWSRTREARRGHPPDPIPRPGITPRSRRIGRGPIPVSDFEGWYYKDGD